MTGSARTPQWIQPGLYVAPEGPASPMVDSGSKELRGSPGTPELPQLWVQYQRRLLAARMGWGNTAVICGCATCGKKHMRKLGSLAGLGGAQGV